jgi:PAS domain S-box-containing protein
MTPGPDRSRVRGPRHLRAAIGAAMATADGLLHQRGPDVARRLSARERRVEGVMAALFGCTSLAMLAASSLSRGDALAASLLVVAYALVARVRFELGPALVRPTQLVFVPMVFVLPPLAVPALVAAGAVIAELPEIVRRRAHPQRALVAVCDSWYAVGPAVAVALMAPGAPAEVSWHVFVVALVVQFAVDFVASTSREWLGAGIPPRELASVLVQVYLVDACLSPIGWLAVLAAGDHPHAYLLAIAPGALLSLIASERRRRIETELALGRAYRSSTRELARQAEDLSRHASRLQRDHWRVGEAIGYAPDRDALERVVLSTIVEAVNAECGRLTDHADGARRVEHGASGGRDLYASALGAAEATIAARREPSQLTVAGVHALASPLVSPDRDESRESDRLLAVARAGNPFSPAERELLDHLAAQAAVSLENLRLHEGMRKVGAELRAILAGVADAVTAEDRTGGLVYLNPAAMALFGYEAGEDAVGVPVDAAFAAAHITDAAGHTIPSDELPGRRVFAGDDPEPLDAHYRRPGTGEPRWLRVKALPVRDDRELVRLAISVIEDITEIKQAEEAQRFLAESSRALAGSLDIDETLPEVARLAVGALADSCEIHLLGERRLRRVAVARFNGDRHTPADTRAPQCHLSVNDDDCAPRVVRTGNSELLEEIREPGVQGNTHDGQPVDTAVRSPVAASVMAVPIRARDAVVGAITLRNAESGRRFGAPQLAVAEDLGMRVGATVENSRLYRTRSAIAQTLQASLLPPVLPDIPGIETAALYRAAGEEHEVGGDFYDVFSTAEGQWFLVMGDVCGKGAEAAAITALARYTIRAAVLRHRSPAGILRWLNAAMLRQQTDSRRFATIACARLDLSGDGPTATVATGGHPCPRVLRATGLVEELGAPGTLLGAVPSVRLEDRATRLMRGDSLILYTDGLTEAGAPTRVWSPGRLDAAVGAARRQSAQGIVESLARDAMEAGDGSLRDDLALLAVRAI